jgi:hypothetical protein
MAGNEINQEAAGSMKFFPPEVWTGKQPFFGLVGLIGGVVLARAVRGIRGSPAKFLREFDKRSADCPLTNMNLARRSCDLEANQVRRSLG